MVDAQPLSKMNAIEKSQHIAYLAQNTQIHWDLSVYDVIALGLAAPLPKEKERSKIQAFSEKFAVTHLLDKPFQTTFRWRESTCTTRSLLH